MSKFKRKAISVDAELISELIHNAKSNWGALPIWVREEYEKGNLVFTEENISVRTKNGIITIGKYDDYLIKGENEELYSCNPNIFSASYEKIE